MCRVDQDPAFTPDLFAFVRDLAAHNDRAWFAANKDRYEAAVREPALAFVEDVAHRLPEVSPHFVADARRTGGSLFRIHRDTRFSKDKTPYKTHVGVSFRHAHGRDVHSPVHYLHLEPGRAFLGCGIWQPDTALARRIRDAIVARPGDWRAAVGDAAFRARFALGGDALKRAPQGYPADHPLIADLRRKDFVATTPFADADVVAPAFIDDFIARCADAAPFMRFLCCALGVPY